jgi:septal ring factor EnvC (AmiA/AmiB activator)
MRRLSQVLTFALAASLTLGSCSLIRSDVNSRNPLVADQAQRVKDLQNQVNDQDRLLDSEKSKQKALKYQLKSAKQELKARKQQAKNGG